MTRQVKDASKGKKEKADKKQLKFVIYMIKMIICRPDRNGRSQQQTDHMVNTSDTWAQWRNTHNAAEGTT